MSHSFTIGATLLLVALPTTGVAQDPATPTKPAAPAVVTLPKSLQGLVRPAPADNEPTSARVELGKQLFFDPRLSGTGAMACVTCHLPEHAFTDQRAVAPKDDGSKNTRNSPTMYHVGFLDRLYWCGRAKTLEGNVVAAWKAQLGGKPEVVAERLSAVPAYQQAFLDTYGGPPNEANVGKALASFLRTLHSGENAYDRFVAGQADALTPTQQQGMALFLGKGGCAVCHTPPLFTDRGFHNIGIGMAAEKPDVGAAAKNAFDDPSKTGAFKTPTLRDVARTAPYFHDGSAATLTDAVRLMAAGGHANPHRDPLLIDRKLDDAEIAQLVAFLEALSGTAPFQPPTLPK